MEILATITDTPKELDYPVIVEFTHGINNIVLLTSRGTGTVIGRNINNETGGAVLAIGYHTTNFIMDYVVPYHGKVELQNKF